MDQKKKKKNKKENNINNSNGVIRKQFGKITTIKVM